MRVVKSLQNGLRHAIALGIVSGICYFNSGLSALARPAVLTATQQNSQINVRQRPSVNAYAPHYGIVGDAVDIISQTSGDDGMTWYQVRFERSGVEGWVRSDHVRVAGNPNPTLTPQPSPTVQPTARPVESPPAAVRTPTPTQSPSLSERYSDEEIQYFLEIAFGAEFGSNGGTLRKWSGPIKVKVNGNPTAEDLNTLNTVAADLNQLTEGAIDMQIMPSNATQAANIEFFFVPEREFSQVEPNYRPRNMGFFWAWWNANNNLDRARILITTEGVTQQERSHLIREELTQSMGLMQDSYRYRDSIFYQGWTDVNEYSELDKTIISMLYRQELSPGITKNAAEQVARGLNRGSQLAAQSGWSSIALDFALIPGDANSAVNSNQPSTIRPSIAATPSSDDPAASMPRFPLF